MSCTLATTYLHGSAHGYYKPPQGLFLHLPEPQHLEASLSSTLGLGCPSYIVYIPYPCKSLANPQPAPMTPEPAPDPTWRVTTMFFKRGRSVVHVAYARCQIRVKPTNTRHTGTLEKRRYIFWSSVLIVFRYIQTL